MTDRQPLPHPTRPIPGLPRWADLPPTVAELAAAVTALPALREAHATAEAEYETATAAYQATSPPQFTPPAEGADLDALLNAVLAHNDAHTPEQAAARDAAGHAGERRRELRTMVVYADGHELVDGFPVRVSRSSGTYAVYPRIQIASNARESRRYVEAEQMIGGHWRVELGDLDTRRGSDPVVTIADEAEVRRVGLAHVLDPLRALAGPQ